MIRRDGLVGKKTVENAVMSHKYLGEKMMDANIDINHLFFGIEVTYTIIDLSTLRGKKVHAIGY